MASNETGAAALARRELKQPQGASAVAHVSAAQEQASKPAMRFGCRSLGHDCRHAAALRERGPSTPQQVRVSSLFAAALDWSAYRPLYKAAARIALHVFSESPSPPSEASRGRYALPGFTPAPPSQALPNPSLNLTRYGRPCKPGPRQSYYRRVPGLQALPPRAA